MCHFHPWKALSKYGTNKSGFLSADGTECRSVNCKQLTVFVLSEQFRPNFFFYYEESVQEYIYIYMKSENQIIRITEAQVKERKLHLSPKPYHSLDGCYRILGWLYSQMDFPSTVKNQIAFHKYSPPWICSHFVNLELKWTSVELCDGATQKKPIILE